jgi:hypothetical protein
MPERRRSARYLTAEAADRILIQVDDDLIEGVASNISDDGFCVVVFRDEDIPLGEEVLVIDDDRRIPAVARNVTFDMATAAYGMQRLDD